MRMFRNRQNKRSLVSAAQYISSNGVKPEVPNKLLKKTFFLSRLIFGNTRWQLKTRDGFLQIYTGDFIVRYADGCYGVIGPGPFVKLYERV